ncbi:MAG: GNAT family N-acetyltransferase [Chloroflexi bacterium]|nr:GNAT family N-acetyltransferase [Chloroflexota bacterium]
MFELLRQLETPWEKRVAALASFEESLGNVIRDPQSVVLVVEADNQLVAMLQMFFFMDLFDADICAYIENVITKQGYRRRGIGSALMNAAVGVARERKAKTCKLLCNKKRTGVEEFYKAMGFRKEYHGFVLALPQARRVCYNGGDYVT